MKRVICSAMIIMAAAIALQSQDADAIREWEKSTWRVNMVLADKGLDIPAVQFAVFKNDPVPEFTRDYREFSSRMKREGKDRYTDETSMMSVTWDILFRKITGDELYLLVPGEPNILSSNDVPGKIWLVTKCSSRKGEPVVWVIPVDVKTGVCLDVKFTMENSISLGDIR